MTQHMPPQAMSLFDLIGRSWEFGSGVRQLLFNRDHSSVLALLEDGRLAFLRLEDAEDPDKRTRMELETGRTTIRPREAPLPQPVESAASLARPEVGAVPLGAAGFAFASGEAAQLWRATARGQTLRESAEPGVTALAAGRPGGDGLFVARGEGLERREEGAVVATAVLDHPVTRLSLSPDGAVLACAGGGRVSLLDADNLTLSAAHACPGAVAALAWSPEGRWLVGGCEDKALLVIDLAAGQADRIIDFPAPVRAACFGGVATKGATGALVASGAFRTVAWALPELPFGSHEGTPLETGKPGLTLVEAVAAHPGRDLCATGYANGLVTICQLGSKQELMLREGCGNAASALAWSADGRHLAIGTAAGTAALVTFPKTMFK